MMMKVLISFISGIFLSGCAFYWLITWDKVDWNELEVKEKSAFSIFAHQIENFESGHFNVDTGDFSMVFTTHVKTESEYFSSLATALGDSKWREVDQHRGYRMYLEPWEHSSYGDVRYQVNVLFDPQFRRVYVTATRDTTLIGSTG